MAKDEKDPRKKAAHIFNHNFDGNAHKRGETENELAQVIIDEAKREGVELNADNILGGLRIGFEAHVNLARKGKMSPRQAEEANHIVLRLLDLLVGRFWK